MPCRLLLALLFVLPSPFVTAGERGYLTRDVELKAEPAQSAAAVGKLARDTDVEVLAEQRAWTQVKAGTTTGWMLAFYVMKGERAAPVGLGRRLSEAWSLGTERKENTSATIGVRGLDEEDLKSAQFSEQELKRLEGFMLPRAEGERFAGRGGLKAQPLDYFPAPGPAPAASSGPEYQQ